MSMVDIDLRNNKFILSPLLLTEIRQLLIHWQDDLNVFSVWRPSFPECDQVCNI